MNKTFASILALAGAALGVSAASAGTLDQVKQRGQLVCGVSQGLPGFSQPNDKGEWAGLDVDGCKGIAAAIFNDASKVKYVPLTSTDRFTALQSGEIDVLYRNSTWTMDRDTAKGIVFVGINYFDGQGFLVRKKLNVKSALELNGASICVQQGTTTELNLADYFRANNIKYEGVVFKTDDETIKAYDSGRCDVYTTDASGLAANRIKMAAPDEHVVLPEIISKEPLGPSVRRGDDQWASIVKWSFNAALNAEELGITKTNVDEKLKSDNPEIKRLLGVEGKYGEGVGLTNDFAYRIVKLVGNYGESFDRTVGEGSPLKIKRGLNALWNKGGLQYAPPVR